jgi:polyvinyl alcohol dehydrogenase (cytochrome)
MRALGWSVLFVAIGSMGFTCTDPDPGPPVWPSWGGDLHNTHHASGETEISPSTVAGLQVRWKVQTSGNVSAIPTLSGNRVYVTDWGLPLIGGSQLYAIDRDTGEVLQQKGVTGYTLNLINNISRSSPAVTEELLVFGDSRNQPSSILNIPGSHGAVLYAVERRTGNLRWKTTLDTHPLAIVTMSPTVYQGVAYVGVSSYEEAAARLGYPCCSFRGSMLAVELATGRILWRTFTVPEPGTPGQGFSGGAVWGSSPTIDEARGLVYVATGNDYTFPDNLEACLAAHPADPPGQQSCYDVYDRPDNYADSVLALDLHSGGIRWAQKLRNFGAWTFACDPDLVPWLPANRDNCEDLEGADFDFGQAPMLVTTADGAPRDLLVVGQKSGVLWAFDPANNGAEVWATTVGPGGVLGGMEFGSATDGQRAYVQITNFDHTEFELIAGPHAGERVNGGIWAAVDLATGEILWQTPDPSSALPLSGSLSHTTWGDDLGPGFFGTAMGPLTIANGVLFAGSMDQEGHMYALDAATGAILWSFASGGSVMSAPSIADGQLFWGSGYHSGFNNNALYSFGL